MALDAPTQENSELYELGQESNECGEWVRNLNELKEIKKCILNKGLLNK